MSDYISTTGGVEADRMADIKIAEAEQNFLQEGRKQRRNVDADAFWTGIALSGGGIRSATFGLGVVQALARENLLKEFDYISSVSGGSYLASSLQFWWNGQYQNSSTSSGASGLGPNDFPYGCERLGDNEVQDTSAQRENLEFLRSQGYYLTPGNGLTAWSLVYVVFRTILVSLLVWIPLLVVAFLIVQILDQFLIEPLSQLAFRHFGLSGTISPFTRLIDDHWRLVGKLRPIAPPVRPPETVPCGVVGVAGALITGPGIVSVKILQRCNILGPYPFVAKAAIMIGIIGFRGDLALEAAFSANVARLDAPQPHGFE
jgi:Patatin-like phospholipase